jgi:hypothetical protein
MGMRGVRVDYDLSAICRFRGPARESSGTRNSRMMLCHRAPNSCWWHRLLRLLYTASLFWVPVAGVRWRIDWQRTNRVRDPVALGRLAVVTQWASSAMVPVL